MKRLALLLLLFFKFSLVDSETPQLSLTEAAAAHSFDISDPNLSFANMCTQSKRSFLPKVNPISGEYVEEEADIVVAGCEPISFRRYYGHMDHGDRRYGLGWRINPEINIVANLFWEGERFAAVGNQSGAMLYMDNQSDIPIPQGFMGGYSLGNNSRYNYTNLDSLDPHNTLLYYRTYHRNDKEFQFLGYTQDGSGKRKEFYTPFFGWHKRQKVKLFPNTCSSYLYPSFWIPYQLLVSEEKLPNGNVICYEYQNWQDEHRYPAPRLLKSITAYNGTKTKKLGEISLDYTNYDWELKVHIGVDISYINQQERDVFYKANVWEVSHYFARGSNNQWVRCAHTLGHKRKKPILLDCTEAPQKQTLFRYDNEERLSRIDKGEGRCIYTDYDGEGKVREQRGPYGVIGRYAYHQGLTEIWDAENIRSVYHYDDKKRITSIERNGAEERFVWDEKSRLIEKSVYDQNGHLLLKQHTLYDSKGNPLEETLTGNLTGSGKEESITIYRSYEESDPFNLVRSERDGFGKLTTYSYKPNTNLVQEERVYDGDKLLYTTSYDYDDCAVCIRKTVEGEGYKRITLTHPKQSLPCFGLPESVEEKTVNAAGKEILLSKMVYHYHPSGQPEREEHYDSEGTFRYALLKSYDEKDRLISSTDPLGYITTFIYDNQDNLIARRTEQFETLWEYDLENRPISESAAGVVKRTSYDKLGRADAYTDPSGFTTRMSYFGSTDWVTRIEHPDGGIEVKEYDPLGNVIKEIDPKGYVTIKKYTIRNQPTYIHHPDNTEEHFRYYLNGMLASYTDRNGRTTTYSYDVLGNLIEERSADTVKTATYSAFHKLSETDEKGVTTDYTHLTQSLVHVSALHFDQRESLSSTIAFGYALLETAYASSL